MAINLNQALPAGTYVYVGRRTLRHESEADVNQEERAEHYPEQYPHTFIDFGGAKLSSVLEHAGGKQGCVVDTQKIVRDAKKHTLNEVKAWRESFNGELMQKVVEDAVNLDEQAMKGLFEGEPFVVINFQTAGSKLAVPKQPVDILNKIKEEAPEIYEVMLADLTEEQQLGKAVAIYNQLMNMSG